MMDKLADSWEEDTYYVIDQVAPGLPVYIVQSNENGNQKTLHRNNLLPVGPSAESSEKESEPVSGDVEEVASSTGVEENVDVDPDVVSVDSSYSDVTGSSGEGFHSLSEEIVADSEPSQVEQTDIVEVVGTEADVGEQDGDTQSTEVDNIPVSVDVEPPPSSSTPVDQDSHSDSSDSSSGSVPSPEQEDRPVPAPRRSRRTKQASERFRSGDWIHSQIAVQPLWRQKVEFMVQLLESWPKLSKDPESLHLVMSVLQNI